MNMPLQHNYFDQFRALPEANDPALYKTLLESTMAIPWKIDWATMRFVYIGPQIEPLLGWSQDSWISVEDWASRIHPEDRDNVVNFCVSQSVAGVDHEADYRALTKDKGYVWIRDVVHVVRNEAGEVESLIGFMFDISERKRIEHELLKMQKKLEALSFEDGLTGCANRRLLDERLQVEWNAARAVQRPLSLVLLDIDHFKQYNDLYGHVQGDACLVQVAGALKQIGLGTRGIFARYGGEEFALLLPETDEAEAQAIAEQCRAAVEALQIRQDHSPFAAVTVSVGVGTVIPPVDGEARHFCDAVDKLLYTAKQAGRNRVVSTFSA
ncbi:sensor domain-containing diguanylate cyclase [Sphingomonas sp. HF-S4]|uniref:diguanylate cyclase n=1 Tax=Sphingomonas agrestis TaxID=3080540 RepID=A0ABU3Y9E3_9SPHN|nr:sensor domain-containing diguanylate cyclase [Sphingomonas sp. HF-S4]MDV3457984.1 sensor domain-containing diguanylate cyclase [Sphingomonas sp. HF-S4]